jgi:hypothetical protein
VGRRRWQAAPLGARCLLLPLLPLLNPPPPAHPHTLPLQVEWLLQAASQCSQVHAALMALTKVHAGKVALLGQAVKLGGKLITACLRLAPFFKQRWGEGGAAGPGWGVCVCKGRLPSCIYHCPCGPAASTGQQLGAT